MRCKLRNTCTRTERWLMKRKPLTKIPQPLGWNSVNVQTGYDIRM